MVEVNNIGTRSDRNGKNFYHSDIDGDGSVIWSTGKEKPHHFKTVELAEKIYDAFLEEIRIKCSAPLIPKTKGSTANRGLSVEQMRRDVSFVELNSASSEYQATLREHVSRY